MRIAYVCADRGIPLLGHKGASAHVRQITGGLAARGHELTAICAQIGSGNAPPSGVTLRQLPPVIDDHRSAMAGIFRDAACDVVIERYSLDSGSARAASAEVGLPLVLEVNSPLVLEAARHRGLADVDGALAREREVFASMDAAVVVSAALVKYVTRVAAGAAVHLIPNGVDLELFSSPPRPAGAVVGFVGSMKPWHGIHDLVTAFATVVRARPDARLILVGDGPEREALEHQSQRDARLRRAVAFVGPLSQAAVPGVVAEFTIAVAPYRPSADFYFSPLKVLEYLAAGVPVVYPDLGELAETVGPAGLCYPAGDTAALAAAMTQMLDDDGLRRTCAARARGRVRDRSWGAVARAVENVALGLLASRAAR